MAKTVDLNTVDQVSPNSATKILVENGSGDFGYISKIFNEDGGLAGVPNLETFATKDDLTPLETKENAGKVYETKEEASSTFATKQQLDEYIKINITKDGNVAYMNNEWNGGLMKLTTQDQKMCKVTLYNGADDAKTYVQLIVKDEAENANKVAKINGTLDGFYYIKTSDNTPKVENEIATLGDVYTRTLQEIKLDNGDFAKIQNQNDGGVMQYVTKDGANNAVCVNNGTGQEGIGVELCALTKDGQGSRIMLNDHAAYYTVGTGTSFTDDNKIVTQKDLKDLKTELQTLKAENESLKTQLAEATKTVNNYTEQVSQLVAAAASVQAEPTAETETKSTKAKS